MAKTFTLSGTPYSFPEQGANPPWGENVTDWAEAVTDILNTLSSSTDILNSSFSIANNQSAATNVIGLAFDISLVRSAIIEYSVYRTSSTITSDKAETGTMWVSFNGSTWSLARMSDADTGVVFSITPAGQVQYTSSDVGSTSYSGTMKFRARTTAQ